MKLSPKCLLLYTSIAVFGNVCLWLFLLEHSPALSQALAVSGEKVSQSWTLNVLGRDCKVEQFAMDLDDEPGAETLLRVADSAACRYLIFKNVNARLLDNNWKLLGNIDVLLPKTDFLPDHMVMISGGKKWLVMQGLCGTGSGFSSNWTRLFTVNRDGVKEVLSFISSGLLSGWDAYPIQDFDSRIVRCDERNGMTTVEVEFTTTYYLSDDESRLWGKQQKAVYTTNPGTGKLALNEAKSDISEQEMKDIYENDTLNLNKILQHNFGHLAKVATGTNTRHKRWLRDFLSVCRESQGKQRLQRMLQ